VIDPGQYLLIWADGEPGETSGTNLHTVFRLDPTNGAVVLSRSAGAGPQILDYINYNNVGTNRSFGSFPAGQLSFRQTFYYPTPRSTNNPAVLPVTLYLNEWMAANASFVRDPADQDYDDWFEIYNPTTNHVDLTDFTLTDTLSNPMKFRVPSGVTVPPQGFLLVWADEESNQTRTNGDLHVNFKLSQAGESIGLYDPAGRQIDAVTFDLQTDNVSQGRWPDGAATLYSMRTPTPHASNVIPTVNPDILSLTLGPGNAVTLVWAAQAGRSYRVQFKNDLNETMWTNLGGDVTAMSATASANDTLVGEQRFYRVLLVQ
jgi:hypothetical protein